MRYTSFGIEDNFQILDFIANTERNEQHFLTNQTTKTISLHEPRLYRETKKPSEMQITCQCMPDI